MSDDNVISLGEKRDAKAHSAKMRDHDRGEAFKFEHFTFLDDTETPNGVVVLDDQEAPIGILLDVEGLTGICMDADTARRMAKELEGAANEWDENKQEEPPPRGA